MIRTEKPEIVNAILEINPNADVGIRHTKDGIDNCILEWNGGTTPISKEDIKAKLEELTNEYNAQDYARKRALEYPSVQDFMEAYTEKEIGGDETKWNEYKTKYNKVRTDNPKE